MGTRYGRLFRCELPLRYSATEGAPPPSRRRGASSRPSTVARPCSFSPSSPPASSSACLFWVPWVPPQASRRRSRLRAFPGRASAPSPSSHPGPSPATHSRTTSPTSRTRPCMRVSPSGLRQAPPPLLCNFTAPTSTPR
jgi:hypothetical protein